MAKATQHPRTPADLREAQGLSIQRAAALIGVAPQVLARVESGGRGVTVTTLERVADYYGIPLVDLVAGCVAARAKGAA